MCLSMFLKGNLLNNHHAEAQNLLPSPLLRLTNSRRHCRSAKSQSHQSCGASLLGVDQITNPQCPPPPTTPSYSFWCWGWGVTHAAVVTFSLPLFTSACLCVIMPPVITTSDGLDKATQQNRSPSFCIEVDSNRFWLVFCQSSMSAYRPFIEAF